MNHLQVNISKTKEVIPVFIQGEDVKVVHSYKYHGVHPNNRLEWAGNIGALYKKGHRRLYFLQRLRGSISATGWCRCSTSLWWTAVSLCCLVLGTELEGKRH